MSSSPTTGRTELRRALDKCRAAFVGIAVMSGVLNVLMLAGSFFMLLVYDRVLPSRSVSTLIGLLIVVSVVYIFQVLIDQIRSKMLIQVGASIDVGLSGRVFDVVSQFGMKAKAPGDGLQPVRDLDTVRSFMSSAGPTALLDLPWMVLFLIILFIFHPYIGLTALVGAIVLIGLTLMTDRMTQQPSRDAVMLGSARNAMAEAGRRNAEVLRAMGMRGRYQATWNGVSRQYLTAQQRLADVGGGLGGLTKTLRLLLQSLVLAVGAYLVITDKATGGVIIASSILTARALAPVELAIANWKGFVAARQSWARLNDLLRAFPPEEQGTPLPPPVKSLSAESVSINPPGVQRVTVQDVSFSLAAGDALGVIGPSASGKSSLIRALVGVWQPLRGRVRLDGAALDQWNSELLGRHIGYLPQDVELLEGTVAQNIARFDPEASSESIIAAARQADVHELIVRLPEGYDTEVGANGSALSAGQRQRVALARALYGDPFLIVLDEPNSNLDADGENALTRAIIHVRARGGIVIIVSHRPSVLANVDTVLFMAEGKVRAFGPKNEVLPKILAQPPAIQSPGGPDGAAAPRAAATAER